MSKIEKRKRSIVLDSQNQECSEFSFVNKKVNKLIESQKDIIERISELERKLNVSRP